jgi:hypothetical protein
MHSEVRALRTKPSKENKEAFMDMTHRQKVDHLIAELGQQGVSSHTVAPPLLRLLWALGLSVPPHPFVGFRQLTLLYGIPFGVLWGVGMWLWVWQGLGLAGLIVGVPGTVLAGLLFGLVMAGFSRWMAARLRARYRLPSSWEDYPQA